VAVAVLWVATVVVLWQLHRRSRLNDMPVLRHWAPSVALVALATVAALGVHPVVNDRGNDGAGTDADDAVLVVIDGIRHGADPYEGVTYLGNPPANGPGAAVWFWPFASARTFSLGLVVALAVTLAVLRWSTGGWQVPSLVAVLVAGSIPFWEALAQGSDHLVAACAMTWGAAVAARWRSATLRVAGVASAAVVIGVLATIRVPFGVVPALVAAAWWWRDRRAALVFGMVGTATVVALHAAFIAWSGWDGYHPVQQLLVKSDEDLGPSGRWIVAAGCAVAAVVVVMELGRRVAARPEVVLIAGVGIPMASIAVAGLIRADGPSSWSAGTYLLTGLVATATFVAVEVSSVSRRDGRDPAGFVEGAPLDRAVEGALRGGHR
jgi:hypothetical protein